MARRGFTLVEMLVVLSLILLLAATAILFIPRMTERAKSARGGEQLQGWLLIARQWAKRDQTPTGLRLTPDSNGFVKDLQYVQQSPNYYAGASSYVASASVAGVTYGAKVVAPGGSAVDFYNGYPSSQDAWAVQVGDYLELDRARVFKIVNVVHDPADANPNSGTILSLSSDPALPSPGDTDYKIFRSPRPLAGEQTLSLPASVAVDVNMNVLYGNSLPHNNAGAVEIMFSPKGGLMTGGDKVILWVRDVTADGIRPEDQTLIAVYRETGFIAAHPPDLGVKTQSSTPLTPGTGIVTINGYAGQTITVADPTGITPGSYLIIDVNSPAPFRQQETVLVIPDPAAVNGNQITVSPCAGSHSGPYRVVSDPYSFARDGRSSGL